MISIPMVILGLILLMLATYLALGLAMTSSLRRGIRKIWTERENPKTNLFTTYLICILFWTRVDWNNVEVQNNWAMLYEAEKELHKE
jgi:hypothetical protein